MRRALLVLLLSVLAPVASAEVVHLVPEEKAAWTPGRMFGFLRPGHNYGERKIEVETTPSHAVLDLYYVRAGFQKRYEQADAPATVVLPSRSEASKRDTVTIRASADGYEPREVTLRVRGSEDRVLLELDPLANTLQGFAHSYFGGRGSVTFLTAEAPEVRLQKSKRSFSVALHETARGEGLEENLGGAESPLVAGVAAQQLGTDLIVRVALAKGVDPEALQVRSRQSHDPIRDVYAYSIDLTPADGGAAAVEKARIALERIATDDVTGCALSFDEALREALDEEALARALAPRGAFTDRYLRAAMRRLGEVSPGGRVRMLDGSEYATTNALELSAALSDAAKARGFLALLRRFVDHLEAPDQRDVALRSLVAPQLDGNGFGALLAEAKQSEARCVATASRSR